MSNFDAIWSVKAEQIADANEETALIVRAKTGDEEAIMRLFAAYVPALLEMVKRHSATLPIEDARQAAFLGFLELIKDHDPHRSSRLAGKVRAKVQDALSAASTDASGGFTVPPRTLRKFYAFLRQANGDVNLGARLAAESDSRDMSEATFRAIASGLKVNSLDVEIEANGGDQGIALIDDLAAPRETSHVEDALLVEVAFSAVDDLEEKVCRIRYGFDDYDEQPDGVVGDRLGMGRIKTLRVRERALDKMRAAIGSLDG